MKINQRTLIMEMYKGCCNSFAQEFFRGYVDGVLKMKNKK